MRPRLLPWVVGGGRGRPQLAAERLKGTLYGQRQDKQAGKGTPLAVDAVSARGVSVQPPGRKEGCHCDAERKDGVRQLLVFPQLREPTIFPQLRAATIPGGVLSRSRAGLLS